jgi:hypothetical protein
MAKIDVFGNLNKSVESVKMARRLIENLWTDGETRLNDSDIEEMMGVIKTIGSDLSEIKKVLKEKFGKIAPSAFEEDR